MAGISSFQESPPIWEDFFKHLRMQPGHLLKEKYLQMHDPMLQLLLTAPVRLLIRSSFHRDALCVRAGLLKITDVFASIFTAAACAPYSRSMPARVQTASIKVASSTSNSLSSTVVVPSAPLRLGALHILGKPWNYSRCRTHYSISRNGCTISRVTLDVAPFLLRRFILRHGAPREVLSDRGRLFLSDVVETLLGECNSSPSTTAFHSLLMQRLNLNVGDMLSICISLVH